MVLVDLVLGTDAVDRVAAQHGTAGVHSLCTLFVSAESFVADVRAALAWRLVSRRLSTQIPKGPRLQQLPLWHWGRD